MEAQISLNRAYEVCLERGPSCRGTILSKAVAQPLYEALKSVLSAAGIEVPYTFGERVYDHDGGCRCSAEIDRLVEAIDEWDDVTILPPSYERVDSLLQLKARYGGRVQVGQR